MTKINAGDRVEMLSDFSYAKKGEQGTVIAVFNPKDFGAGIDCLIMFDEKDTNKHSGNEATNSKAIQKIKSFPSSAVRAYRCQYVNSNYVVVIKTQAPKLIVTIDGRITTAKLIQNKRTVAEGRAACAPSEVFNYPKGIQLAVQRCLHNAYTSACIVVDPKIMTKVGLTTLL
ncbi:MAG: hypothetical protein DBY32_11370 [Phascolarctobacterium sp.]|nr:MAG: hypothetical protein DBY32_11370 [Phascolarctobacterium sp.]